MTMNRETIMCFDLHANVTRKFEDLKGGSWAYLQDTRKSSTPLTTRISRLPNHTFYWKHMLSKACSKVCIFSNRASVCPWIVFVWWQLVLLMWNTTALTHAHFCWWICSHLWFKRSLRRNQGLVSSSCGCFRIIGVLRSCKKSELRHEQIWYIFLILVPCRCNGVDQSYMENE